MDAQAQDRAHRIGQTREVHIYRMVCKGTIEENILKKSMQKRELDHFAIQRGNFTTEHFTGKKAVGGSGGGGNAPNADDGGGAPQKEVVVGGEQGTGLSQSPRSAFAIAHTRTRRDYYDQKGLFPRTVTLTVYSVSYTHLRAHET